MVLHGFFSKEMTLKEPSAWLKGSLHGEMVLQIDGECAVDGSIQDLFEEFYIAPKRVPLLLQAKEPLFGTTENPFC